MAYERPVIGELGAATAVILGTSSNPTLDNGENVGSAGKPMDIPAGLDE